MSFDIPGAKTFLQSVDLSGTRRKIVGMDASTDAGAAYDKTKNQAQVVGSGLFSFQEGVDPDIRAAISNAALLAQLLANKQVDFEHDPKHWFDVYAGVLQNLGWLMEDRGWNDYSADGTQAQVNEKILNLLTVSLGAAPTAVALVTAAIQALKGMDAGSPWITLWSSETQKADMARFQIGTVNMADNGKDIHVYLVACILSAASNLTQVLFFKWKQAHASFRAATRSVSVNTDSARQLAPDVREKIVAYQKDYLSSITNL